MSLSFASKELCGAQLVAEDGVQEALGDLDERARGEERGVLSVLFSERARMRACVKRDAHARARARVSLRELDPFPHVH